MGARGKKSAAELAVVTPVTSLRRPDPPTELTDEQAQEWRAITGTMAADRLPREVHPLLGAYCRHTVALRKVAQLVQAAEESTDADGEPTLDLGEYDKLLKMQERESRCLASLAVRLGIASHTKDESTKRGRVKPPWED